MSHYARAIKHPSLIPHPQREETRGIVIHWTAGHKAGDLATLDGPNVDCQYYVDKDGEVFEFLDSGSQAWHAFHTANHTCIGIEHEGSGEAWTAKQLEASAQLVAWLTKLYNIPVEKVDPHTNWHGIFGHRDLQGIDSNTHTDTVPEATGWDHYLKRVKEVRTKEVVPKPDGKRPAQSETLQVILKPRGAKQRAWQGWDNGLWALKWIAKNGLKPTTKASISLAGKRWDGPDAVTKEAKALVTQFDRELTSHVDVHKAGLPTRVTRTSPLIAPPRATAAQLESYIRSRPHGGYSDADIGTIVGIYEKTASAAGLDLLLVIAQMVLETGNLSSEWSQPPRRNPAGIGVTGKPGEGVSFPSWKAAARAHVGRLLAYSLPKGGETAAQLKLIGEALRWRPLPDRLRGSASTLNGLAGTWAADKQYAAKIVRVANAIAKTAA